MDHSLTFTSDSLIHNSSIYTWSPYIPTQASSLGLQGIPMLWGSDQISDFQNLVVEGYANWVLGMNEYALFFVPSFMHSLFVQA